MYAKWTWVQEGVERSRKGRGGGSSSVTWQLRRTTLPVVTDMTWSGSQKNAQSRLNNRKKTFCEPWQRFLRYFLGTVASPTMF